MAFLFDFFPVLLFFGAYKLTDFFVATAVFIAATLVQIGYQWIRHRKVKTMHLVSAALVLVFGGATLLLQDEELLKWKVSVVYWLLAVGFLLSGWVGEKRTVVERLMGSQMDLPAVIWNRLNLMWVAFYIALGFLNLYVMFNYNTDAWVNFKLWGVFGLIILFALIQGVYLSRHLPDEIVKSKESN